MPLEISDLMDENGVLPNWALHLNRLMLILKDESHPCQGIVQDVISGIDTAVAEIPPPVVLSQVDGTGSPSQDLIRFSGEFKEANSGGPLSKRDAAVLGCLLSSARYFVDTTA